MFVPSRRIAFRVLAGAPQAFVAASYNQSGFPGGKKKSYLDSL
jgi:hypothetical protein